MIAGDDQQRASLGIRVVRLSSLRGNIDRMRAHGTGEADARIQIIEWNDELFEKQCKPDVDDYILYKKIYI